MKLLFVILFAGCVGTLCRYGITLIPWGAKSPYSTLTVNLLGAFLAGLFYVVPKSRFQEIAQYFPTLFIGFLGGLTVSTLRLVTLHGDNNALRNINFR